MQIIVFFCRVHININIGKIYFQEVIEINQEIYCSVNTCHYWDTGNHCKANKIMVTSDGMGNSLPDTFDAPQATNAQVTPAHSYMETCCKTFVSKNNADKTADGVYHQS